MNKRTANGAMTLPGNYYTSHEIFREELERIFFERWICIGRASQLTKPGAYFLHRIGNESILVTRNERDEIHAFYNVCRHRGTRLCTETIGQLNGKIQCPYHAWTYSLDGALLAAPNMAANFQKEEFPLHPVSLAVWQGFLFINLSHQPIPFEEDFLPVLKLFQPYQLSDLIPAHQIIYDIRANWKMLFQNYSECYHCPKVHPALARLTPYRNSSNVFDEGPFLGGAMSLRAESMTMGGRFCATPFASLSAEEAKLVHYYTIFPSLFVSPHPDYVLVHRIEPQAPDRTTVICEWLFHPEAIAQPEFDASPAVAFWDMTNRQDWHVCELSQEGVSSRGYEPGPYADLESLLAAFDREYLRSLSGGRASVPAEVAAML
jgi:glycine betaine catabolism A